MKKLSFVTFLIVSIWSVASLSSQPERLQLLSRESYNPRQFQISDSDWRWLGQKRTINVAVWHPEIPPLGMFTKYNQFEGMTADYLNIISQYLGVRSNIMDYPSRDDALNALKKKEVDIVVDASGKSFPLQSDIIFSNRFISDHPVLVHRKLSPGETFTYRPGMQLAIARWYVDDAWIEQNFPGARIMHFDTDDQAMASVALHNNDFFIGNLVTSSYLLDRNYTTHLEFQSVYPERDTGFRFLFNKDESELQRIVNSALSAIPLTQSQVILQQWSESADIWRLRKNVDFNSKERKWIKDHPVIKVATNSFYAPFTMADADGKLYGVTADILKMITLRTGIKFIPVPSASQASMEELLLDGQALMIGALSYSDERTKNLAFSRPYFDTPVVTVVRNEKQGNADISRGTRIAIAKGNPMIEKIKANNPTADIIETTNASMAMQDVIDNKADMAVHSLFGASYMINRYFKDQLSIAKSLYSENVEIGFAVSKNEPELLSILNKSLENISPADINNIIKKWQTRPDVRLDTWKIYQEQFVVVAIIAGFTVFTSLIWVFYMRRQFIARKKAQAELQAQLNFSRTLINTLPLPVYVTDANEELRLYNESLKNFFKAEQSTLLTKSLSENIHPLHSLWSITRDSVKSTDHRAMPLAVSVNLFDGEKQRSVMHQVVPYKDSQGLPGGHICTWIDVTEHEELNRELSAASDRAEQANRAKSTFLATMSHEIRTPVSAIIGLLELAVNTPQTEQDKDNTIRVAWESARNLMGLIGDILDMARIESGRLELTPEWVRTTDLLPSVTRVFEGLARQKSLRLRSSLPPELPYEIYIDPVRFRQILSNLVSNAIKFTERGYVEVELDILFGNYDEQAELKISVRDSGKGMSEEEQADIFDPWVQTPTGRMQSGSGLGLAICSQLVHMMGGYIKMNSRIGQGTEVKFAIPTEIHVERQEVPLSVSIDPDRQHHKLRILAVDDHPANRMLLGRQLSYLEHDVTEAVDGDDAWDKWQSADFDVVITDCNMPGMDGLELTRLIRQYQTKTVIILGLTANAWPEERNRCQAAGMDDCLFKPLQLPQLRQILDDAAAQLITTEKQSPQLGDLLKFEDLRTLTHDDENMLKELLTLTLTSNRKDLKEAEDLFSVEDWPELAKCIHRISGAAQIIGAARAEASCSLLEHECLLEIVDSDGLTTHWQEAEEAVRELNKAIDDWLLTSSAAT